MKPIKLFLVTILFASTTIFASTTNPAKNVDNVETAEVYKLLKNPNFIIEKDMALKVKFTVNNNNEIVVLQVESKELSSVVEGYIKYRLNYKRLSQKLKKAQVYTLPVRLVASR